MLDIPEEAGGVHREPPAAGSPGRASASTSVVLASSPATLSVPRDTEGDPEAEIEKLQRQMDELKSQISNRRRKTVARGTDKQNTES